GAIPIKRKWGVGADEGSRAGLLASRYTWTHCRRRSRDRGRGRLLLCDYEIVEESLHSLHGFLQITKSLLWGGAIVFSFHVGHDDCRGGGGGKVGSEKRMTLSTVFTSLSS
ncbi:unnamed protein product, partial [Mycena citricolor]